MPQAEGVFRRRGGPLKTPQVAFCMEQTLGHRAHTKNIQDSLRSDNRVQLVEVPYQEASRIRVPWAVRGSAIAMRRMRRERFDVAFFHTQTVALLAPQSGRAGSKFVVSVDATPKQMDEMGAFYSHGKQAAGIERAKAKWYRSVFKSAAGIVAWSYWAAESLGRDYGVDPSRIEIVHPGASAGFFEIPRQAQERRKPRILFVGGDFERKGGGDLLAAYEGIRTSADLTIVTESTFEAPEGVEVLRGLKPGTPELFEAFAKADVFCLPTRGDCTPVVLAEAQAAGLPVVTTSVGSNCDAVLHERTGFIVQPGDRTSLEQYLGRLVENPSVRFEISRNARERAYEAMDAAVNARRLLEYARRVA